MKKYKEQVYPLLKELCKIPAPSHMEEKRAEYCKNYLIEAGFDKVWVDEAKNVICEYYAEGSDDLTVIVAHTDTVFPDLEPMPFYEKDGKAYCPGIGDDTASVAVMMLAAKYLKDNNIVPSKGMVFVCNSCEEGLGNLKGTKAVMEYYKGRVKRFISIDGGMDYMYTRCVGSHRYLVEAKTIGGHSLKDFGNENAINHLAKIINKIYAIDVPEKEGCRATYNVGIIEGGTSVNTIAQYAKMLCEYRSDDVECLNIMKNHFEKIFAEAKGEKDCEIEITLVGDRPCANGVSEDELMTLANTCKEAIEGVIKEEISFTSGSTDANIPMSLGIPGVVIGVFRGGGCHTREEWIEIDSLDKGFEVAVNVMKAFI